MATYDILTNTQILANTKFVNLKNVYLQNRYTRSYVSDKGAYHENSHMFVTTDMRDGTGKSGGPALTSLTHILLSQTNTNCKIYWTRSIVF